MKEKIKFGKYKNKFWSEVPDDYLLYWTKRKGFTCNHIFAGKAKLELDRRKYKKKKGE